MGWHATAGCRRSLEIGADVIAAGYLHPHVLASVALPPVIGLLLSALGNGRRESLRQAGDVAKAEAGNVKTEPDALGGITTFGRIRRLRDLGLSCTQVASFDCT
jgi:hypothetical protein